MSVPIVGRRFGALGALGLAGACSWVAVVGVDVKSSVRHKRNFSRGIREAGGVGGV